MNAQKVVLDNHIRLLMEPLNEVPSVCIGLWVCTGSRDELPEENGLTHFIEHMLFKGTSHRGALEIAKEIDKIGGVLNAFTGREYTCFYTKVLRSHMEKGFEILSDIFFNSLFREEDIERERGVILQEIKMVEDTPDEYVHELFYRDLWGGDPLGAPISGTLETVSRFTREDILGYFESHYLSSRLILAVAGNIEPEAVVAMGKQYFGSGRLNGARAPKIEPAETFSGFYPHTRELEQLHVCWGGKGCSRTDKERYPLYALSTYLGGGMSSRLFQEVREKRGLVYSIYSYANFFRHEGIFAITWSAQENRFAEIVDIVKGEIDRTRRQGLTEKDLREIKEQMKGNLLLSLEGTNSRMNKLATDEIYFGRFVPIDEVVANVDAMTLGDLDEVLEKYVDPERFCMTTLGPQVVDGEPAEGS
ncbi:MAG: insulinase family protein [Deltaproteobacteria bacterium]|nr:insulinase family protein [Deltaproteobacteria bacterium]